MKKLHTQNSLGEILLGIQEIGMQLNDYILNYTYNIYIDMLIKHKNNKKKEDTIHCNECD